MRLVAPLVVAAFCAAPALAQSVEAVNDVLDTIFGEHERFETAFETLQSAVADGDAQAVAELAAYPLVVKVGERREIADAAAFVAVYATIMTDEIVAAVRDQSYAELFANDQGIMFGNGQVWMSGVCADDACADWDVRIITIQSTAP